LTSNGDRSNSAPTGDRKHACILGALASVLILTKHALPASF
jgi:hypothetical protein